MYRKKEIIAASYNQSENKLHCNPNMKSIFIQGSIAEGVTMNEIWQGHENLS